MVLGLARSLGFAIDLAKSDLVPSQEFTFLGMTFDSRDMTIRPKTKRLLKLEARLSSLLGRFHASAKSFLLFWGQWSC